jgi:3-oxoacyl-[acyl-carrier protein] reductase
MRLEGKVALITGADSAVGAAIALRFAREGAVVVLNDVVSSHLDRVAQEIAEVEGGKALIALGDVTRAAHVDRMMREALDAFGRIDILVNHAGDTEEIVVTAAFLCAEAVCPAMRERRWGRVINATKDARLATSARAGESVIALTHALALGEARFGITVNCVVPGVTTATSRDAVLDTTSIPMGRIGDPRDVAAALVFFASDEAGYITGQVLFVDGGISAAA